MLNARRTWTLLLLWSLSAGAAPLCGLHPAAAPALRALTQAMAQGRFIAYQPTQIRVVDGRASTADEAGIAADLKALRPRFDALITYGALNGADRVADVAATTVIDGPEAVEVEDDDGAFATISLGARQRLGQLRA